MNLILLTSSALHENRGPQARLKEELDSLSALNKITIICLGAEPDNPETKSQFDRVIFLHSPIIYDGWSVLNAPDIFEFTLQQVKSHNADLVILQMEIWDLIREFSSNAPGKFTFAAVFHAMPFLSAPINPTTDFERDVIEYTKSGIADYRKEYILKHYTEAAEVLNNIIIIANNATVNFYLNQYFSNLKIWVQSPFALTRIQPSPDSNKTKYDFVYMARIEKGKGLEYLKDILCEASQLLIRPASLAIMGKPEDDFSKDALTNLQMNQKENYTIDYLGWADSDMKRQTFAQSGIFLYPSLNDNYPTVILEALAYRLPVVLWETPYSKVNFSNSPAIQLVKYKNIQKYARAAAESLAKKEALSKETTKFVNSFPHSSVIAEKDTELLESITAHAKSAR